MCPFATSLHHLCGCLHIFPSIDSLFPLKFILKGKIITCTVKGNQYHWNSVTEESERLRDTLLNSRTWVRKRREQRKTEGQTIKPYAWKREVTIGCWLEPKTNTAYKRHDMKSMIFFSPSTGHVFYLLILFQHFNMYVFIFSHEGSPQNRYVLKYWKKISK